MSRVVFVKDGNWFVEPTFLPSLNYLPWITVDTKASSIGSAEHPHAAAGPEVSQEGLPQTDAAGTGTGEGGEERGDGKEGERKEGGQVEKSAEVGDAEGV